MKNGKALQAQEMKNHGLTSYNSQQVELIKQTVCKGATDDEFMVFLHICRHLRLDPLMKQIYSIPRRSGNDTIRTTQVSIDGLRAIAERTGRWMPGRKATFSYDKEGNLETATAYVLRMDANGSYQEIEEDADLKEYQQSYNGRPQGLWSSKPKVMLAKCAEARALRRAFPTELTGTYTHDEMPSADLTIETPDVKLSMQQQDELYRLCASDYALIEKICANMKVDDLGDISANHFEGIVAGIKNVLAQRERIHKTKEQESQNHEDSDLFKTTTEK